MNNVEAKLDLELQTVLSRYSNSQIYLWSLEGEVAARGPGAGWSIQIHFDDATQPGGVRHVTIGAGTTLSRELADRLKVWFRDACRRLPGKLEPQINLFVNG